VRTDRHMGKLIVALRNFADAPKKVTNFLPRTSQKTLKNVMNITPRSCQYVLRPLFLACTIILLQCMDAIRILITEFFNYPCALSSFNVGVIPSLKLCFYFDRDKTGTIFWREICPFCDFKMWVSTLLHCINFKLNYYVCERACNETQMIMTVDCTIICLYHD
jgi:hypothetical protein